MFIRRNRWRLHHLFLKGGLVDDYKMSPAQICLLLEIAGGLEKPDQQLAQSVEFTEIKDAHGTLAPLTPEQVLALVGTYGVDRHGLLDYRRVLDDFMAEAVLEHRLRRDRVTRRQQANNQRAAGVSARSVHDEIAWSISESHNPYSWLIEKQQTKQRQNRYTTAPRPRPVSPPRELQPLERGWRGVCRVPCSHGGKCPGYNRGEGNPFLAKWYVQSTMFHAHCFCEVLSGF
jgi:hypothetical protein